MPLTKPTLASVSPGQPVTAQGWNAIVDGLDTLYDAVLALGGGQFLVSVVAAGHAIGDAHVVAQPLGDGRPIVAVPPFGEVEVYTISGVTPGQWRLHIEAEGFQPETRDVTAPATDPISVTLTLAGVAVPDLFGVPTQQALAVLATLNLDVDVIMDVMGHEVAKTTVPPQYQNQPVLEQQPPAGTVVDPASQRLRLVIATALEEAPVVTMPSLIGLTIDEAAQVLDRLGLKVGTTTIRATS